MSTATPDVLPVTDHATGDTRGTHWVCVTVTDHPFIGLCEELVNGNRTHDVTGLCPTCRALASVHAAGCGYCAPWVRRLL